MMLHASALPTSSEKGLFFGGGPQIVPFLQKIKIPFSQIASFCLFYMHTVKNLVGMSQIWWAALVPLSTPF